MKTRTTALWLTTSLALAPLFGCAGPATAEGMTPPGYVVRSESSTPLIHVLFQQDGREAENLTIH